MRRPSSTAAASASAHSRHGWSSMPPRRYGSRNSTSSARLPIVKEEVTPTCWSCPSAFHSPSSSEPIRVPGPFLCQRKPATTQSAVRACLILAIVRLPGAYASEARLAITPSSPAPLEWSIAQVVVAIGQAVEGDERGRRLGGQHADARGRRMDAQQERVEVEPAVGPGDDHLAIEHEARVGPAER